VGTCPTEQQEILNNKRLTSTDLAAPKGRVLGRGSALLEEHENFNTTFSLGPIWQKMKYFSLGPIWPPN
jgi:hypothetical protein